MKYIVIRLAAYRFVIGELAEEVKTGHKQYELAYDVVTDEFRTKKAAAKLCKEYNKGNKS